MKQGWRRAGPIELFECHGSSVKPRVVITAGVHGDEYEGAVAVAEVARSLRPADLAGSVVCLPIANPTAFSAGQRTTPGDGKNLARTFPGNPEGTETERLAAHLWSEVVRDADYLIDLHSGGVEYRFLPVAGFYGEPAEGNVSYDSARRFGLAHLWQLPPTRGVLSHEAWTRGIPAIGMEYLGAGQLSSAGVDAYVNGIFSCLSYWGLLQNTARSNGPASVVYGDWLLAETEGIFRECATLGQEVDRGEAVAQIFNPRGEPLQKFAAPAAGIVLGLRSKAYVHSGDWGVLVGVREPER